MLMLHYYCHLKLEIMVTLIIIKVDFFLAFGHTCVHWDVSRLEHLAIQSLKDVIKDWMFNYKGIMRYGGIRMVVALRLREEELVVGDDAIHEEDAYAVWGDGETYERSIHGHEGFDGFKDEEMM
ncbi:hypothetical protein KFK09_008992 [Dendrobium nobile]|uniref:Uncharacterized protein n=1 Tax=Dendrobium nobile TaxID=94219 RepID=A0A8T3BRG8_DENNO|nr:hypothetical protein KFK09_008992 [Dendrobium nobile]